MATVTPSDITYSHWGVYSPGMCWGGSWTCCHILEPKNEGCLHDSLSPAEFQMRCQQVVQHAEIGDITVFLAIISSRGDDNPEIARWGLGALARLSAGSNTNKKILKESLAIPTIVRLLKMYSNNTSLGKVIIVPILRQGCTAIEMMCFKDGTKEGREISTGIIEDFITLGSRDLMNRIISNEDFIHARMDARRALTQLQ